MRVSFVSAIVAHAASGDPLSSVVPPLVALFLWGMSYASYRENVLAPEARATHDA